MQKVNKRVFYNYTDYKKGTLSSYIDVDMNIDDEWLTDIEIQKYVARKWENLHYKDGEIKSIEITSVQ